MSEEFNWEADLAANFAGQTAPEEQTARPEAAAPEAQAPEASPATPAPESLAADGNNSGEPKTSADPIPPELVDLIPESLRGATLQETLKNVAEDRKREAARAHKAGYDANRMAELQRQVEIQNLMIERVRQQQEALRQPAAPPMSMADKLRQRGVNPETDLIDRAPDVLAATAQIAAEESAQRVTETVQQYEARIAAMEREVQETRVRAFAAQSQAAFTQAKPAGVPQDLWDRAAAPIALSLMAENRQMDLVNPEALLQKFEQFYGPAASYAAPTAAGVARAAAPPVSGKPSAGTPAQSKKRFSERDRGYMRDVAKRLGLDDASTDTLEDQFLTEWGTR